MTRLQHDNILVGLFIFFIFFSASTLAFADGTETLGAPTAVVEQGTGTVAAGVGMIGQDLGGYINLNVPAAVKQVLLYWEGQMWCDSSSGCSGGDTNYDFTTTEIIAHFNNTYPGSKDDYNSLKNIFEGFNEQGCPLGNNKDEMEGNGNFDPMLTGSSESISGQDGIALNGKGSSNNGFCFISNLQY
jgi:hypothetical protein